ncbi:hypothetical protein L1285_01515 [Pseudoalteromonas sp. DL2-H2.2]|uniref:hypothetical protein n=1 Tax=Pseudoalteromonas sp. DL2-H2.2 TaxID=2908889 RepID=UPI001F37D33E|nr:hypothetical protein [Pseudoalteromonas sp. DL2-H2.2]MCF2907021.1 hypothetical protein [Pseudoalteromonas sp. DL2-H2.2]
MRTNNLGVVCCLIWLTGFYLSFDTLHIKQDNHWLSGFLLMLAAIVLYIGLGLRHLSYRSLRLNLFSVLSFLVSLLMPFELNTLRNNYLLEHQAQEADTYTAVPAKTCNDRGFCKPRCLISFEAGGQIAKNYFKPEVCDEQYIVIYAQSRPDIFKLVER